VRENEEAFRYFFVGIDTLSLLEPALLLACEFSEWHFKELMGGAYVHF